VTQAKQIADEINKWINHDEHHTEHSISALLWAMSMDPDILEMILAEVDRLEQVRSG